MSARIRYVIRTKNSEFPTLYLSYRTLNGEAVWASRDEAERFTLRDARHVAAHFGGELEPTFT